MRKIETIWHHLLFEAVENSTFRHTQKHLAEEFGYSVSTVHHSLRIPTAMGAVRKEGKFFVVQDARKLLQYAATMRALKNDVLYTTCSGEPVRELEGLVLPQSIVAGYSAARHHLTEPPADYSVMHCYIAEEMLSALKERFPAQQTSHPNIIVLKKHPAMDRYGPVTSLVQTYVDCWNFTEWYAGDFVSALYLTIDGLLP
jgi:hypothetical protein